MILALMSVVLALIGGAVLVTKWGLDFAKQIPETPDEPAAPILDGPELDALHDEAVDGIKIINGGAWHEIEFQDHRYRKCLSFRTRGYCASSLGWLYYPEGTPCPSGVWSRIEEEYGRRLAHAKNTATAIAARKAWGVD